jgi:hypothetical protein
LIDLGRSVEASERPTKAIDGGMSNVAVSADTTVAQVGTRPKNNFGQQRSTSEKCRNCGKDHPHLAGRTSCPAYGTTCRSRGKQNHWSKCCRSSSASDFRHSTARSSQHRQHTPATLSRQPTAKRPSRSIVQHGRRQSQQHINQLDNYSETSEVSDDDVEYTFSFATSHVKQPRTSVILRGNTISMMIDSGASVNIIN